MRPSSFGQFPLSQFRLIVRMFLLVFFFQLGIGHALAQLTGGPFTIGTGGTYATLSAAVSDLNSMGGASGAVVFNIKDGIYTEQVRITSGGIDGSSSVTFQSESGNASDVTVLFSATSSRNNYLIEISNAGNIVFNQITFSPVGTLYGRAISITNSADNITVSNCRFNGQPVTSTTTDHALIYDDSCEAGRIITNNSLTNGSHGIYSAGASSGDGNIYRNNTFTDQYFRGMVLALNEAPVVDGNQITAANCVPPFVALEIENAPLGLSVVNNMILIDDGQGIILNFALGTASKIGLMANNFVAATVNPGIIVYLEGNDYLKVYHNTIYNGGSSNPCLTIDGCSNINVENNILVQTSTGGAAYQVDDVSAITVSNYNNFDTPGDVALWNFTSYSTLMDFQNGAEVDLNSSEVSVTFVDAANGDLHLAGGSLGDPNLIGDSSTGVLNDIDGDTRDPLFPYMGADEGSIALPVELVSFSADVTNEGVTLSWITATETNNFGFEVEKKSEFGWRKLGFVAGAGTTTEPQHYRFVDNNVNMSIYSYRLKQIDTDGLFTYSNEIKVEIATPNSFELSQNYPNPFNPETSISYQMAQAGKVELTIYNARGETVRKLVDEDKPTGIYSAQWNGSNDSQQIVGSGTYFYTLKVDSKIVASKSMILVK